MVETTNAPRAEQGSPGIDWYYQGIAQVAETFHTSVTTGLTQEQAATALAECGPNRLPEAAPRSSLAICLAQFASLPVALLTLAAGLSLATDGRVDAAVIMGVVAINAVIGFVTEQRSEKVIRALRSRPAQFAQVLRDGQSQSLPADSVVPGDVILLRSGGLIPADSRVVESYGLSVNEATLTGESMPVEKTLTPLAPQPAGTIPLAERTNMVYQGTLVTAGQGRAIAVATGSRTELGHIQHLVDQAAVAQTPLQAQLDRLGSQLVLLSCGICALVFGLGVLRGYAFVPMLKTSISLAVAAVPEGLPAIATTTLALGIAAMRRRQIYIRTLSAVEALGAIQTLCLDKTGTITENKMIVSDVLVNAGDWPMQNGQWLEPAASNRIDGPTSGNTTGQLEETVGRQGLKKLMEVAGLCSEAAPGDILSGEAGLTGSPTETALLALLRAVDIDLVALRDRYPLLALYPRTLAHPVMSTVHQVLSKDPSAGLSAEDAPRQPSRLIAVKGSPLVVLSRCDRQQHGSQIRPLTEGDRQLVEQKNRQLAERGLRILGFAYRIDSPPPSGQNSPPALPYPLPGYCPEGDWPSLERQLIWLGLVGLQDPIRAGVPELIRTFEQAGIKPVMVTGDQSPTARAIAAALNMGSKAEPSKASHTPAPHKRQPSQLIVLETTQMDAYPREQQQSLFPQVDVFARVSPAHKLEIIQALQAAGQVVAMTGDGINDTPALKQANIGIAMGAGSYDGVHEVADVVIADNNLRTLIEALAQGRTIYQNIRKSVHFLLSTNLSEIIVTALLTAVAIGTPLSVMQLLWLNLVTDVFPGLALALEPAEADVLNRSPRDPQVPILKAADFGRIVFEASLLSFSALGLYGYGLWRYGVGMHAGSLLFMGLTIAQVLHALACRSEAFRWRQHSQLAANGYLRGAIALSLALQLLPMAIPELKELLNLVTLSWPDWLAIALCALLPLGINEFSKPRIL